MERAFAVALDEQYIVVVQPGPAVLIWTAKEPTEIDPAIKQLRAEGYDVFDHRGIENHELFLLRYFCESQMIEAHIGAPTRFRPEPKLPGETDMEEDLDHKGSWH